MLEILDTNMTIDIYVKILNEDLIVWRPVKAKFIKNNIFRIIDKSDFLGKFDEELEFVYGDIVKCYHKDDRYYAKELDG